MSRRDDATSTFSTSSREGSELFSDECSELIVLPATSPPGTPGPGSDEADRPSPRANISRFDIFLKYFAIFLQVSDTLADLYLFVRYPFDGEWTNFALTAMFVLVPSCVVTAVSMRMYNADVEINSNSKCPRGPTTEKFNKVLWCKYWWPTVVVLQLAPLFRSTETLKYAKKSLDYGKKGDWNYQNKYYKKMLNEDRDIVLLQKIEGGLESAPQLILQFAIMQTYYPQPTNLTFYGQVIKILLALGSLGWRMTSYDRCVRLAQPAKTIITKCGLVVQFFRHFMTIVSRIIAVSLIAGRWPLYTGLWFLVHWVIATVWISITSTAPTAFVRNCRRRPHLPLTSSERIKSKMFAAVLGLVSFFTYVNLKECSTFLRRAFYYVIYFAEIQFACYFWYVFATDEIADRWYFVPSIILCILSFLIGIVFTIVYYKSSPIMKKQDLETSLNNRQTNRQCSYLSNIFQRCFRNMLYLDFIRNL